MKKIWMLWIAVIIVFSGCSDKEEMLSNKSANYWYQKIINSIAISNFNQADDYYSSLYSEHVSSPLLPNAMLLLSKAHADFDELLLSQYYLDEYLKRFGNTQEREYVEYLKVKNAYLSYKHPNRNQKFLDETIATLEKFTQKYPNSTYLPIVHQMLLRLELGREVLKKEIAKLYKKMDKPKAEAFYQQKSRIPELGSDDIKMPHRFWMRKLFE